MSLFSDSNLAFIVEKATIKAEIKAEIDADPVKNSAQGNKKLHSHEKTLFKIARLTSSSNEAEREFSCLSYQMGPTFMNQKAVHIERKQQTAEYDRFKKALTKIVMQQGIESSALGISKSAARIKI